MPGADTSGPPRRGHRTVNGRDRHAGGELIALELDDVDLTRGLAMIRRGKGGKGRIAPFGPQTARALDRYIRLRRGHPAADSKALWLGARTRQALGPHGLRVTLLERAEMAGIKGFHPHVLRHTAASRWLAAGGSEGGLMAVAGWSSRDMLNRYARASASERCRGRGSCAASRRPVTAMR